VKSKGLLFTAVVLFLASCSNFYQRDFVVRKIIVSNKEEVLFYDLFQTGIDNYDFIFYASFKGDTTKMVTYNLADAIYTALEIKSKIQNDTLFIEINMPVKTFDGMTYSGTKYQLRQML